MQMVGDVAPREGRKTAQKAHLHHLRHLHPYIYTQTRKWLIGLNADGRTAAARLTPSSRAGQAAEVGLKSLCGAPHSYLAGLARALSSTRPGRLAAAARG